MAGHDDLGQPVARRDTLVTVTYWFRFHYLCQGGYVIVGVLFVCCLLATLLKNFQTDLHEIFRKGWQWASEQTTKFWWRSRSCIWIRVIRALAGLCKLFKVASLSNNQIARPTPRR